MPLNRSKTCILLLTIITAIGFAPGLALAQTALGEPANANPFLGPSGTSTMHGDAGSSDVTPFAGPEVNNLEVTVIPLLSACPTLLQGSDSLVVALCTAIAGQIPQVHLIDSARTGVVADASLAQLDLTKGSLLGGVYAYLDNEDRLVVVDGSRHLLKISHQLRDSGQWQLISEDFADLTAVIPPEDSVVGIAPDWSGNIWFATSNGVVGFVDRYGNAHTFGLPSEERVGNSISTSPKGVLVATTEALYQFSINEEGNPRLDWRQKYDRGSARKPGQLSWGTGSTPTYFGPKTGYEYSTIVDNSDDLVSLLVFRSKDGELICQQPVLAESGAGSENSPIGVGNSVIVASTYGYPYPAVPDFAGSSEPASAPFFGGMTRIDVEDEGMGCHTVWDNALRSSAVPHLSLADGLIYTVLRDGADSTTILDKFLFTAVDFDNGSIVHTHPLPGTALNDTLQMSGLVTSQHSYLQGTITGILSMHSK
ncbi:MAG: hypothetical protein ACRCSF_05575 [Mycobacteriaceae bacterium]